MRLSVRTNEKQLITIINNFFINITRDLVLKEDNSSNANTLEGVPTPGVRTLEAHLKLASRKNISLARLSPQRIGCCIRT